jgi:hypothetical protein
MELKITYSAFHKMRGNEILSGELYMYVTKVEAFEICQNCFIYHMPDSSDVVPKVLARAEKKARSAIFQESGMRRNEYLLEIEVVPEESDLFTNTFIKSFFKWLLEDAYGFGYTIYNDVGLSRFFHCAVNMFAGYYDGDLVSDAKKIQYKIAHK